MIVLLASCGKNIEIKSETKFLHEENKQYTFDAEYPVYNIAQLDDKIKNCVGKYLKQCKTEAADQFDEEWFRPFEMAVNKKEIVTQNRYISVNIQCYYFTGGAHGMTFNNTFSYDTNTKDFISTRSIAGDNYTDLVRLVKKKLKTKIGAGNFVDDGIAGIESLSKFLITDQGVEFIFDPYEVAAYTYGVVVMPITYKEYPFNIEFKNKHE
ncbi:MAG: PdaC/SigV domain-containing protein [Mangrovibacterium sp.]